MGSSIGSMLWLNIGSDPTWWILDNTHEDTADDVVRRKLQGAKPCVLPVAESLEGQLVLSPHAGNVSLITVPKGLNWNPSEVPVDPFLYLPTAQGPTWSPGNFYKLAPGADLDELQRQILAAMADRRTRTVEVTTVDGSGVLMLNGATLPFVVLCKVRPRSQLAAS
jgi:hypothetical protein